MATESHLQPSTFIHVLVFCLNLYPHPMICCKGTSFDQLFRMDWLKRKTNLGVCPAHPTAPIHWISLDHAEFHLRQEISSRSLTPARFEQEILSISLTPETRFILSLQVKLYVWPNKAALSKPILGRDKQGMKKPSNNKHKIYNHKNSKWPPSGIGQWQGHGRIFSCLSSFFGK